MSSKNKFLKYQLKYQELNGGSFFEIINNLVDNDILSLRDLIKLKQSYKKKNQSRPKQK